MATRNDITGDALVSKRSNENYRNNYDLIFGKKKNVQKPEATGDGEEVSMSELRESKRDCVCSTQQPEQGRQGDGDQG